MTQVFFHPRLMSRFVEKLAQEIGLETYRSVLSKSDLSKDWQIPQFFLSMDASQAAEAYSYLQSALRTYYGRGARGILMRIGTKLWEPLLNDASFTLKVRSVLIRWLPKSLRRKQALELLASILSMGYGSVTVHTLDLDLLFVDRTSPTTIGQVDDAPICFVTFGLIRECLYWVTGDEHDIEERACRGAGASQCEFKITIHK